jgi:methylase of polypeptide subunit release factors
VVGETFDLITCNAPYVVSPERRWAYRDSGLRGDDLTALLVDETATHLAAGGYATLLGSWLVTRGDDPEERPVAWVGETGCDGWVLASPVTDPLDHAASWNAQFFGDPAGYEGALDEWTAYLEELGARGIVEGAILLHRRGEGRATVRVDEIDEDLLEPAGKQIRRAFANRARLAGMRRSDLAAARLARAMPLRIERDVGNRGGELALDAGTNSALPATATGIRVVESLNGKATLKRLDADRAALSLCRDLLELGALRFAR